MYINKTIITPKAESFLKIIYDYNVETHRPMSSKDISDDQSQSQYVGGLVKKGLVERVMYSYYIVTDAGEAYINKEFDIPFTEPNE